MWVLPGGGVDPDEPLHEAVMREVLEETGISVVIQRQVATYTPINCLANLTHVYECRASGGALMTGAETRELAFFPLTQLPDPFFFVHRDWLDDAVKASSDMIYKPLIQVNYFNLLKYFCRHPIFVLRFALSRLGMPINDN